MSGERVLAFGVVGKGGSVYAQAPTGEVQLIDSSARNDLACQIGPTLHPLMLCADRLLSDHLTAALAAEPPPD